MGLPGNIRLLPFLCILAAALCLCGCESRYEELNLDMYQYRDTRNVVKFVFDSKHTLEKEGLEYFHNNRDQFITGDYYLYIYDLDGEVLFHAGMKDLEKQNLEGVTDKDGKEIHEHILSALDNPDNPHSWIHFTWRTPGKFYPVPKSSCHFRARTPDGRDVFCGAGLDTPNEEKEFIRIAVDDAAKLLKKEGKSALKKISDPASEYNYREVRVFVITPGGEALISPVMVNEFSEINLMECEDEIGHKPFILGLKKLEKVESTWEIFMAKSRYKRNLIKKSLYLRNTEMDKERVCVGAITDLPLPP